MLKLIISAVCCGALATLASAADIPNPRYEAALRRVDKRCAQLNADRVQLIRGLSSKMHADGATRNAVKKACRELSSEWETEFKACASAIVAVEYIPAMIPKPPAPPPPPNISPLVQDIIRRGHKVKKDAIRVARKSAREKRKWIFGSGGANKAKDPAAGIKRNKHPLPGVGLVQGSVGALADRNGFLRHVHVFQIVDSENALIKHSRRAEDLIWLAGVPTAGKVDGESYRFQELFKYAGTKQYTTSGGALKTVHTLERIDLTTDERKALGFPPIAPSPSQAP